jgi:signal transduction histidine kinase/DNA-binding response OmpR family regulator
MKWNLYIFFLAGLLFPVTTQANNPTLKDTLSKISSVNEFKLKADSFYKANDLPRAVRYYKLLLDFANKEHDDSLTAYCFEKLGIVHYDLLVLDVATENLGDAEKIYSKYNDHEGLCQTYITIGKIHTQMHELPKALDYFKKAKEQALKSGNQCLLSQALHRVSLGEFNLGNNEEALKLIKKTIALYKECNDLEGLSAAYNNLATFHFVKSDFTSAMSFLKISLDYKFKINCLMGIALTYDNIGEIFMSNNILDSAEVCFNKSLEYCEHYENSQAVKVNVYLHLSQVNEKLRNTLKSLEYYKLYHLYNDSILHNQNHARIQVLQVSQELNEKENELNYLVQRAEKQKIINIAAVIFLIFLLTISALVYRQYRIKKESNKQLSEQRVEILEKNQTLAEQARKLGELDELKTRFFSNISHEFRTPLTLIKGPAEQLAAGVKNKELQEASLLIIRNANKLQTLINQLLDLSRIERGSMKLKINRGDICLFIRTRASLFSSLANERQIHYRVFVPEENLPLYYDADKLEKIINNLLSNAFKYSKAKSAVEINVHFENNFSKLVLVVSDTGQGISPNDLPHIFDRFYQADNHVYYQQDSSGIGLALVKELVDLYRGTIAVESELNVGTVFTISLPCSYEDFHNHEFAPGNFDEMPEIFSDIITDPVSDGELKKTGSVGPLVLLVEDNADMRQYIISGLKDKFRLIEACNGVEGFEMALKEDPDLIISDVMMPEMDGYQLTSVIKNNPETSHIPVVLLTAKAAEESMLKGFENEADDYLTKPFNGKELVARATNLIRIREKLKEKFSKSIVVNPTEITTTSLDEQFLQTALRVVEKHMDNPEFTAEMFCSETGVSRANMHRKLKALTNQSATEFIRSIRLKRAAQLLQQKSGNISEIATMVGFSTLSYFTSCFKEEFKCLPSEYGKS